MTSSENEVVILDTIESSALRIIGIAMEIIATDTHQKIDVDAVLTEAHTIVMNKYRFGAEDREALSCQSPVEDVVKASKSHLSTIFLYMSGRNPQVLVKGIAVRLGLEIADQMMRYGGLKSSDTACRMIAATA